METLGVLKSTVGDIWKEREKSKHTLAPAAIRRTQRSAVLCKTCTFRSSMKLALFGLSNNAPRELRFLDLCHKRKLASCFPPSTLTKILSRLIRVGCFVNVMELGHFLSRVNCCLLILLPLSHSVANYELKLRQRATVGVIFSMPTKRGCGGDWCRQDLWSVVGKSKHEISRNQKIESYFLDVQMLLGHVKCP